MIEKIRVIGLEVAKNTLSRTRVFSERRMTTYRNVVLSKISMEYDTMKDYIDDVIKNFDEYEKELRIIFNSFKK